MRATPLSTFDLSVTHAARDARGWEYIAIRRWHAVIASLETRPVAISLRFRAARGSLVPEAEDAEGRRFSANHRWTWECPPLDITDGTLRELDQPVGSTGLLSTPALSLAPLATACFELNGRPPRSSSPAEVVRVGVVELRALPATWRELTEGTRTSRVLVTPETRTVYEPPRRVIGEQPFVEELDHAATSLPLAGGQGVVVLASRSAAQGEPSAYDRLHAALGRPGPDEVLDIGVLRRNAEAAEPSLKAAVLELLDD